MKPILVRLDQEDYRRLKRLSDDTGYSIAALIRASIKRAATQIDLDCHQSTPA
jgi:predicted DNA-binding protein